MLIEFAPTTTHSFQEREKEASRSSAFSRLLTAAVVNKGFRDLLLTDPSLALGQGYQGEFFPLDDIERGLILSIQADNLRDFALQLTSCQENELKGWRSEWIPVNQNILVLEPE